MVKITNQRSDISMTTTSCSLGVWACVVPLSPHPSPSVAPVSGLTAMVVGGGFLVHSSVGWGGGGFPSRHCCCQVSTLSVLLEQEKEMRKKNTYLLTTSLKPFFSSSMSLSQSCVCPPLIPIICPLGLSFPLFGLHHPIATLNEMRKKNLPF